MHHGCLCYLQSKIVLTVITARRYVLVMTRRGGRSADVLKESTGWWQGHKSVLVP